MPGILEQIACVIGCDAFFELGYLYVDGSGTIRVSAEALQHSDLKDAVNALEGRECSAYSVRSSAYSAHHRAALNVELGPVWRRCQTGRVIQKVPAKPLALPMNGAFPNA